MAAAISAFIKPRAYMWQERTEMQSEIRCCTTAQDTIMALLLFVSAVTETYS